MSEEDWERRIEDHVFEPGPGLGPTICRCGHHAGWHKFIGNVTNSATVDAPDAVNTPPHYKQGSVECIDAIRAALTDIEFRGYCKGNVIKYVWREKLKGKDEDLKKAMAYLKYISAKGAEPSTTAPVSGANSVEK